MIWGIQEPESRIQNDLQNKVFSRILLELYAAALPVVFCMEVTFRTGW